MWLMSETCLSFQPVCIFWVYNVDKLWAILDWTYSLYRTWNDIQMSFLPILIFEKMLFLGSFRIRHEIWTCHLKILIFEFLMSKTMARVFRGHMLLVFYRGLNIRQSILDWFLLKSGMFYSHCISHMISWYFNYWKINMALIFAIFANSIHSICSTV